jgi:2-keto-3-deoxy-L-fuconate dehydrogenase
MCSPRQGATVIADTRPLADDPALPPAIVQADAGQVDGPHPGDGQRVGAARHEAHFHLQRGARRAAGLCAGGGVELAPHNIQLNAIAQNFVDNPTYFPPEVQANPRFQERLAREVPLGRLVAPRKTRCSPPTCAATRPAASWGRCFRCAGAGVR